MTYQILLIFMLVVVVGMAWYANWSKRNKIYCSFIRINKTTVHKFVKMTSRYVVFDNKRYDIVTKCITFDWWDKGLTHMLFPQWVATLEFAYNKRFPIDPDTGQAVIITPEVRNAMNKEEWVKSYAKGFQPPSSKKETAIQQYLPWIAIGLVALLGFYVYTNMQAVNQALVIITNQIQSIAR